MYKVGDIVRYKNPYALERRGKIISKYKILEDVRKNMVDSIMYIISYDNKCYCDHVSEEDIIRR